MCYVQLVPIPIECPVSDSHVGQNRCVGPWRNARARTLGRTHLRPVRPSARVSVLRLQGSDARSGNSLKHRSNWEDFERQDGALGPRSRLALGLEGTSWNCPHLNTVQLLEHRLA